MFNFLHYLIFCIVSLFFLQADATATEMCLHLSLTPLQLETLESFRRDNSKGREFDAHEVLSHAIKGARVLEEDDPLLRITWVEERFGVTVEKAVQVTVAHFC
jgi:hypothetical protein